jgi:hypothetical protein
VHRAGERAPYTGLQPAGFPVGPVIPLVERAVETGSPGPVVECLVGVVDDERKQRPEQVATLATTEDRSVRDGRLYVDAMLGFEAISSVGTQPIRRSRSHGTTPATRITATTNAARTGAGAGLGIRP